MSRAQPRLILHGGVVQELGSQWDQGLAALGAICSEMWAALLDGGGALDVAVEAVHRMETSGMFLAGRGACPNGAGRYELDASVMNGATGQAAGAIAVPNVAGAVRIAKAIMDRTPHVLITGESARAWAPDSALLVEETYYRPLFLETGSHDAAKLGFGTVGAAVADLDGAYAAAAATAGVLNKMPGRAGDTPIPGSGTWADRAVGVSCTGQGEYFIRENAASGVGRRIEWLNTEPQAALDAAIGSIGALGGLGGMIAAHAGGVGWSFNTEGMKRAWIDANGDCRIAVSSADTLYVR